MAKILWNKQGDPLLAYGKTYFATTTGAPKEVKPVKPVGELDSTEIFNQYTVSPWGSGNDFPVQALDIMRSGMNGGTRIIIRFLPGTPPTVPAGLI
jgi:hypothetical protein